MKNETITFRVDEDTKQQLKVTSKNLKFTDSDFVREAIWKYEELLVQIKEASHLPQLLNEQKLTNQQLSKQLESYESDKNLNRLFSKFRGQVVNGLRINHRSDLVHLIAECTTIDITPASDANTEETEFEVLPISLNAEPAKEAASIDTEAWTMDDIADWAKRNWLLLLLLIGTGVAFLVNRWVTKMSKRPKYIKYQSLEPDSNDFVHTSIKTAA